MKWTEIDIEIVTNLLKDGKKYDEISKITGRTPSSIRTKLFNIGEKWTNYVNFLKEHYCLQCNNKFIDLLHVDRKFCSKSCSRTYLNLKEGKKEKSIHKCINCEKMTKGKYCSNKCQRDFEKFILYERIENGDSTLHERTYKNYLISKFGNKCMECGWDKVHQITNKVPIQLEHTDGDSTNNSIGNLKLLCPNCHSLTPTYGALNKGNGRKNRKR